MKITCEHCGVQIDTSKDKKCPNCGAPYSKNKEYKEAKEFKKKEKEVSLHSKELGNEIIETTLKRFKFVKIYQMFFILVVFIIFVFIIVTAIRTHNQTIERMNNFEITDYDYDIKDEEKEEKINVSFNENADTGKYEIKCDKVSNYEYDFYETEKYRGNEIEYYKFHIVFKNKNSIYRILRSIYLTYTDDNGNENVIATMHSPNTKESSTALQMVANKDVTYSGYIVYEIPKYVKDVTIKYENVSIQIDGFKDKISK